MRSIFAPKPYLRKNSTRGTLLSRMEEKVCRTRKSLDLGPVPETQGFPVDAESEAGGRGSPTVESDLERIRTLVAKAILLWDSKKNPPAEYDPEPKPTSSINRDDETERAIFDAIKRLGSPKPSMIVSLTGVAPSTARRHLRRLVGCGIVRRTGRTRNTRYTLLEQKNQWAGK